MQFRRVVNGLLCLTNEIVTQPARYYRKRNKGPSVEALTVPHEVKPPVDPPPGVEQFFYNRNPRNLERLAIAHKHDGWTLDKPGRSFYHKIIIAQGFRDIKISCVHFNGQVVLSASTDEWCIRKFLYKATDRNACRNLGRIFAFRCLQSGLNEMLCTYKFTENGKLSILLEEIEKNGITLREPQRLINRNCITKTRPPRPWDINIE